jgi:hypothetical protein
MSFAHGKNGYLSMDAPTSPTNVSAYCNSIDFPATVDTAETSTFGSSSKTYVVGMIDHTMTVEGLVDPTGDAYFDSMVGTAASLSFIYGASGAVAGNPKYYGECWCTGYNPSTPIGDAVKFTASFQMTGTITRSTFT